MHGRRDLDYLCICHLPLSLPFSIIPVGPRLPHHRHLLLLGQQEDALHLSQVCPTSTLTMFLVNIQTQSTKRL